MSWYRSRIADVATRAERVSSVTELLNQTVPLLKTSTAPTGRPLIWKIWPVGALTCSGVKSGLWLADIPIHVVPSVTMPCSAVSPAEADRAMTSFESFLRLSCLRAQTSCWLDENTTPKRPPRKPSVSN